MGQLRRWGQSAQRLDAGHDAPHLGIGGDEAFAVQFADGDVEGPLIGSELRETIQGEIDAFADADAGGAGQQEGIGGQVVGAAQFLLQELIVWWRQRFGQIVGPWGEVLAANQVRREGVAVGGEVVE